MKKGWRKIEETAIDRTSRSKKKGVYFEVSSSPYDVPEEIRGFYCENRKKFVVEFRYFSNEPTKKNDGADGVVFLCGVNSGRLYSIEIDVDRLHIGEISLDVKNDEDSPKIRFPNRSRRSSIQSSQNNRREINNRLLDVAGEYFPEVLNRRVNPTAIR